MNKFDLVLEEINTITKNAEDKTEYDHSQAVWQWVLRLKPDADMALQIAALGHDIDRSLEDYRKMKARHQTYEAYKQEHALASAKIVCDILEKHDLDQAIIDKVRYLIENHEIGGEGDLGILTQADSMAFFNDLSHYRSEHTSEQTIDKIKYMYNRLGDQAKSLVDQIDLENEELKKLFDQAVGTKYAPHQT